MDQKCEEQLEVNMKLTITINNNNEVVKRTPHQYCKKKNGTKMCSCVSIIQLTGWFYTITTGCIKKPTYVNNHTLKMMYLAVLLVYLYT